MITVLLITTVAIAVSLGIVKLVKFVSYSEKEEERLPVENYEVVKSTVKKVKAKSIKSKTKK